MTNIIFYHSLIIFGEVLVITVFVHMLYKRRSPTSMAAWLLMMILIPYVTVFLYLIFGSRKRKNRYIKEHIELKKHPQEYHTSNPINEILRSYGIADASENEKFELYTNSIEVYEIFISCIEEAKTSIYISTYIFKHDYVTKNIVSALVKKAKDGVEIKLLIDSLGSFGSYIFGRGLKELKDSGAKVEFFMPMFQMPFRNYINLRNHRKIYIFDNKKVLSGGINLSKEYLGPQSKKPRWEDIVFLVEGSSAEHFFEIFASDWFYASSQKLYFTKNIAGNSGDTFVQVVPSGPDMPKDTLYEALLCAIYSAKERIWIVTPYFIPDASLTQALIIAKHKGLDVRLITPKKSDNPLTDLARGSFMRELEEVGIEIFLYTAGMLHAKAILFDDTGVMLGSVNIDNRSLFLNYEVATFVYSAKIIDDVESWMKKLMLSSSTSSKKVSKIRKVIENLMRILAPQL